MARDDWFRSASWDEAARRDFETRLGRARPYKRPQYLRIKALSLASAGELDGAKSLLERVLSDYPDDQLAVPLTHHQLAEIFERQGRLDEAEREYRRVIAFHQETGNRFGDAELHLAELLLRRGSRLAYRDALTYLTKELKSMLLTSSRFRGAVAAARMYRELGDLDEARAYAAAALRVAEEPRPIFPRHPTLDAGWSPDPDALSEMHDLLR